jgi:hypothetical protein
MPPVRKLLGETDIKELSKRIADCDDISLSLLAYGAYEDSDIARKHFQDNKIDSFEIIELFIGAMQEYADRFRRLAQFFLHEPWFNGQSIINMLDAYWGCDVGCREIPVEVLPLGFPDAYYKASRANRATELIKTFGGAEMPIQPSVEMLRVIQMGVQGHINLKIETCKVNYRVLSLRMLDDMGFLRHKPILQIDPGTPILELVEVLVHELMHHVFDAMTAPLSFSLDDALCQPDSSCLNEGFAEHHTAHCLRSVFKKYPQLEYFMLVRRICHHAENPRDPHVTGAALFRAMKDGELSTKDHDILKIWGISELKCDEWLVTPGIELSLEMLNGKASPRITRVDLPSPELISGIWQQFNSLRHNCEYSVDGAKKC